MAAVTVAKMTLNSLKNINTVIGMLYDENGKYLAAFEPDVFYNTILLDTLKYGEENYVHLKYAENITIRRGETTARFRRWAGMTPTLTPLKEGVPPAADKHAYETMEVGNVFSFGRWSEYTDRVDMSIISEVIAERSYQYGEVANQTKELYARKTWLASPNEYFANFRAGIYDIAFGDQITLDDLRFLVARMKRMQVKPISGKFNYICSPEFINGLIDDPRVKAYMNIEQTTGKLWGSGEPFDMFELSFIPTMLDEFAYPDTEFPGVYEGSDGKEIMRLYAVSGSVIYYLDVHQDFEVIATGNIKAKTVGDTLTYLKDGTAIEKPVTWNFPITFEAAAYVAADATANPVVVEVPGVVGTGVATAVKIVARKHTKSVTADALGIPVTSYTALAPAVAAESTTVADLAALNALIAAGAFMQLPVHRGILFGDEALVKLAVEGVSDTPQIIVKPLGSAGSLDPLNQRQSVGFKVDGFGLAIKRPEAIVITYGIPKNAEFAALTSQYLFGNYELLDGLHVGTDAKANYVLADGSGALRVDGVNAGGYPGQPTVWGLRDFAAFDATVAYSIGDRVIYNNKTYEFIAEHEIGVWNIAHVKVVKAVLNENVLDKAGNDTTSNVK